VHLSLSDTLYGRTQHTQQLLDAFEQMCRGTTSLVLVPGHSGAGKTSLVRSLRDTIKQKNGWFLHGKFNQYQQGLPWFAIRQVLAQLWQEMSRGPTLHHQEVLAHIIESLGPLTHLLIDVIPELEGHLCLPTAPEQISPQEARHRFNQVIQRFLKIASKADHPVVMFIDDWQWADAASLELLRNLQLGTDLHFLLVVAAYRDTDVGASHPLPGVLEELRERGVLQHTIALTPLSHEAMREFVCASLPPELDRPDEFASQLLAITGGNPFFTRTLLQTLVHSEQLYFMPQEQRWCWHLDASTLPRDCVHLFSQRLQLLDEPTSQLLSLGACLGNAFSLDMLATISQSTPAACRVHLEPLVAAGLLEPWCEAAVHSVSEPSQPVGGYLFFHDTIQQAAYQLIDPAQRARVRLDIGHLLLRNLDTVQQSKHLFEIVGHLNQGRELIEGTEQKGELIRMNVSAAHRAQGATAYATMFELYGTALSIAQSLPGGLAALGASDYPLLIDILAGWGESNFLEGDVQCAESALHEAITWARTPLERAELRNVLIVNYTLLARYDEAIQTGREALFELGVVLPQGDFEQARDVIIAQVRRALQGRSILDLQHDPLMSDPTMRAVTRLLITMGPPCYRTHQRLWSVIVPLVVRMTIEHGLISEIAYSHTAFGGLLGWVDNDYASAQHFAELATVLMRQRFEEPVYQSIFYLMHGSSSRHWFDTLDASLQDYRKAYQIGLQSGNLQYAAYGFGHEMYCSFFAGMPLTALQSQSHQALLFSQSRRNIWATDLLQGGMRLFELLGDGQATLEQILDDRNYCSLVGEHANVQVTCIYQIIKMQVLLFMGYPSHALDMAHSTQALLYTVGTQGLLPWPEFIMTRLMLRSAALARGVGGEELVELEADVQQLALWKQWAPQTYGHKYLLACAELAWLRGDTLVAAQRYEEAIEEAVSARFIHWAALACERAAQLWDAQGESRVGALYWQQAYLHYAAWGALAKVTHLRDGCATRLQGRAGRAGAFLQVRIERHLQALDGLVCTPQQAQQQRQHQEVVEELARAGERLRVEVGEHQRTAEKLLESQRLLDATQSIAKVGGWALELPSMRLHWTTETYKIHGVDPSWNPCVEQAIEFYHPEHQPIIRSAIQTLLATGVPFNLKLKVQSATGRERDVHVQGQHDVDTNRIYGVIQDITEFVQLEHQLHQSEKMRAIGQLAGGIAHDFNNQLAGVMGYADMLKHRVTDAHSQRYCENIITSARRSADLTSQLLAFSRKGQYSYAPVSLHALIREVITILVRSIDKNIHIECHLQAPQCMVMGDASQLQSAILNLGLNARDAMVTGGVLRLSTRMASGDGSCMRYPRAQSGNAAICLAVSDSGVGMSEEVKSHLFEPFFTTKEVGKGTGMGLAAVYGTIKNHQGCICVDSAPLQGSTFTICLPVVNQQPHSGGEPQPSLSPAASRSVMVVDDEEIFRYLVQDILVSAGHRVHAFSSGDEAVAFYQSSWSSIDSIILDLRMPGLSGKPAFMKLREINPLAQVIIASGYSLDEEAQQILDSGGLSFLQKPFKKATLLGALNVVGEGRVGRM
jgi:predicted ATPase/signal transduction histidine kinase/CheY-like chemotaxis protein